MKANKLCSVVILEYDYRNDQRLNEVVTAHHDVTTKKAERICKDARLYTIHDVVLPQIYHVRKSFEEELRYYSKNKIKVINSI